jgi:TfoX/Sxy family transcriptional regulator of competence genes
MFITRSPPAWPEETSVPWKKANLELIALLEKAMRDFASERRPMFGAPTFFVRGNMFAGVHEDTVIMRLSPADLKQIQADYPAVRPFTPMGRVMKEYAALPASLVKDEAAFRGWLERSFAYAAAMPPKNGRNKGPKKS